MQLSWRSELHGHAGEDVTTEGVVHLRIRVAVTRRTHAGIDGRIVVEDVVDTQTHLRHVRHRPAAEQIEIVLVRQMTVDAVERRAFLRDAADVAMREGEVDVPWRLPADAQARAQLRGDRGGQAADVTA